jgi:hypothetical protein
MGTVSATMLFAVPNTDRVNAIFSWVTSKWTISWDDREAVNPAKPGTQAVRALFSAARGEFPAPRGVLSLTHPEGVGGNEVKP